MRRARRASSVTVPPENEVSWRREVSKGFDCAELFSRLADEEQEAIDDLLSCLRRHIGES